MTGMGMALMGTGIAKGEHRALEAAQRAISSPLLEETSIQGARGVLINISGGHDLTLHEVAEAARIISDAVDPDANIISGMVIDPTLEDAMKVTVIATGFDRSDDDRPRMPAPVSYSTSRSTPVPAPSLAAMPMMQERERERTEREEPAEKPPPTCPSTARRSRTSAATTRTASAPTGRTSTTTTSRRCCGSRWTEM